MARRTRGPKVAWLPNTNASSIDSNTTNESVYSIVQHDIGGDIGAHVNSQHGVVIDGEGLDPLAAGVTLADVEESGYRLRRIVGKLWCCYRQVALDTPVSVICTAGFIVLRVDPQTGLPAGASTEFYYAGSIRQTADPWIWRRSWILTNTLATQAAPRTWTSARIPSASNLQLGGVLDGPHIDQKTARLVGPEERLFLVLNTTVLEDGFDEQITGAVQWVWDLRVLGSMRSTMGNRRNASR